MRFIVALVTLLLSWSTQAVQPYCYGEKQGGGSLATLLGTMEKRLVAAGFQPLGRHTPPGIPGHGVVIAAWPPLTAQLAQMGGSAIVATPIRVGVKEDGTISYLNLEYWLRAYLQNRYSEAEKSVKEVQERLAQLLGSCRPFGGEVKEQELLHYRYMAGMERFGDKTELKSFASFDEAVATIRNNLAKGVANTALVYELVIPEKRLALFGVATNDSETGEGWWVNKIGTEHIAALPWEFLLLTNKRTPSFHVFAPRWLGQVLACSNS